VSGATPTEAKLGRGGIEDVSLAFQMIAMKKERLASL
jgi:hypothetical protein